MTTIARTLTATAIVAAAGIAPAHAGLITASQTFDAGGTFGAGTRLVDVGGFEGLGAEGREFSGLMAYADQRDTPITVSSSNLAPHTALDLRFSLAVIDSWDGEHAGRSWAPDFIAVRVDGVEVFRESFTNFEQARYAPSYDLSERLAAGRYYGSGWNDSVYDIRIDDIGHTGDSVLVEIFATGSGFEGGRNESFAVDNLTIATVPAPATLAAFGAAALVPARGRRR